MSFLDGLSDELTNPLYDGLMEAFSERTFEFEGALEAATDVVLSEADIAAIMDDNNPDNMMADLEPGDEFKLDAGASDDPSLESSLATYMQTQQTLAEEALVRECEALMAACEADGENGLPNDDPAVDLGDDTELAGVNEEAEEPTEGVSLESLLDSVFNM